MVIWDINRILSPSRRKLYIETYGCKFWAATLSIILHTLYTLNTIIMYCIILLEYVHKSQVNAHIGKPQLLYVSLALLHKLL